MNKVELSGEVTSIRKSANGNTTFFTLTQLIKLADKPDFKRQLDLFIPAQVSNIADKLVLNSNINVIGQLSTLKDKISGKYKMIVQVESIN
jgi:hypothetical protein